jgi:hypothetical protein
MHSSVEGQLVDFNSLMNVQKVSGTEDKGSPPPQLEPVKLKETNSKQPFRATHCITLRFAPGFFRRFAEIHG